MVLLLGTGGDTVELRDDDAGLVSERQRNAFIDGLERLAVAAPRGIHAQNVTKMH